MKFNFRKIASVLASVVMLGSTIGVAAAANYPAPFVAGGAADVAVVYGSNAAFSDGLAAGDLQTNLQAELAKQTATGGTTTTATGTGEFADLFTGSSKIYINDSMNAVKSVVTKTELPTLLKEETFSGNVDAKTTQTVTVGKDPRVTFAKQPTSSDDPLLALTTYTTAGMVTYNATVDFNKAVNFTNSDSKNQELTLFGQKFTVGSSTTATDLVLLKSATKLNFDSSGTTSQEATIEGKTYTVELVSASTSAATIKVTNEAGASEQKEVSEGYSKKINGVTVAVNTADSNNLKYTASVVAGAEKVTFVTGSSVTYGDSDTVIDGTTVTLTGGVDAMTKLVVGVRAASSDTDAIAPGAAFVDPVFGTFKLDFAGLNIADDSTVAREDIVVKSSGDDKVLLDMTDNRGNSKSVQWAINKTTALALEVDSDGHRLHVSEMASANKSDYVVVGNEDEGRLLKVYQIVNQTTGHSNDKVTFQDAFTSETIETTITGEGTGTVTIGGKVYDVKYYGNSDLSDDSKTIKVGYPDSGTGAMVLYPTIQTSKGAKVAFYKPLNISLSSWDGLGNSATTLKVPNGADSYEDIDILLGGTVGGNFTVDATDLNNTNTAGLGGKAVTITNTGFVLNFTWAGTNATMVRLNNPQTGAALTDPALLIFEEKDDNNRYEGMVVTLEPGASGDDGVGVDEVVRTWSGDLVWEAISLASDSKKTKDADLWGSIVTLDSSDSDQKTATISYPDEQIYAQLFVAANDAVISAGSATGGSITELGNVLVKDSELSAVSSKNLIVVGGSCINTVAAKILGSTTPLCSAEFTTAAGVGANQALIKVVDAATAGGTAGKVAMLVAGFEGADTTKAVKYVTTEKPATDVDTSKVLSTVGTVATVAS